MAPLNVKFIPPKQLQSSYGTFAHNSYRMSSSSKPNIVCISALGDLLSVILFICESNNEL